MVRPGDEGLANASGAVVTPNALRMRNHICRLMRSRGPGSASTDPSLSSPLPIPIAPGWRKPTLAPCQGCCHSGPHVPIGFAMTLSTHSKIQASLSIEQFASIGVEVEVGLRINPFALDLPIAYETNPEAAMAELVSRDRGHVLLAHTNVRQETGKVLTRIAITALGTKNPKSSFQRGVESLGLPLNEAVEHYKAAIYESHPEIAKYTEGLYTSKQINGQVAGNSELRKLIIDEQLAIGGVQPTRKAAGKIDFDNVAEQNPSRHESGETLEAQVSKVLEWSGLEFTSSRQPILKLFGEVAEPDFTVTEGIKDPGNELRGGFYVECKNRPTGRTPDSDLIYSMWCICNFYQKPTVVVLEASGEKGDRLRSGANLFLKKQRESKSAGMLKAILTMNQFRGFVQTQIGRAS